MSLFKRNRFYIRVSPNTFEVRSLKSEKVIRRTSDIPFSSDSCLIEDQTVAAKFLKSLLKEFDHSLFDFQGHVFYLQAVYSNSFLIKQIDKVSFREFPEKAGASLSYTLKNSTLMSMEELLTIENGFC